LTSTDPVAFYTIWLKAEPKSTWRALRGQGDLRPMADDRSAMAELRNILVSRRTALCARLRRGRYPGLSVDAAAARLIDAVAPVLQNDAPMFARG